MINIDKLGVDMRNPCLSCGHHLSGGDKDCEGCMNCEHRIDYINQFACFFDFGVDRSQQPKENVRTRYKMNNIYLKFNSSDVHLIKRMYSDGMTCHRIAKLMGTTPPTIHGIVNNTIKAYSGY